MSATLYDRIGRTYTAARHEDPRIAAAIWAALADARSVLNVGAGAGAYEPRDREVVAVEPSDVMIAQRPAGSAPVIRGVAEALPFPDASFDATMSVLSDHHWRDRMRGLRELARVARRRVVIFAFDPAQADRFWLTAEYLQSFLDLIAPRYQHPGEWERELRGILGPLTLTPVLIPHDCADGFLGAYWRRPWAFLDPNVRGAISVFSRIPASDVARAIDALRADLDSGAWHERHRDLMALEELHLGYYVITATAA